MSVYWKWTCRQSERDLETTPQLADKGNESDQWLPSVTAPEQEMKDHLPKTDPVEFKIPQTENWGKSCIIVLCYYHVGCCCNAWWVESCTLSKVYFVTDEDTGGVSNGVPTVATENSATSHTAVQASDARGVSTCGGVGLIYALLWLARLHCFPWCVWIDQHGQHLLHECRTTVCIQHPRILSAFLWSVFI